MKLSKRFEIRLDPKLYADLKNKAEALGVDMSTIARPGIEYAVQTARPKVS